MVKDSLIMVLITTLISCNSSIIGSNSKFSDSDFDSVLIINPFTDDGQYNTVDFYSIEDTSVVFSLKRIGYDLQCDSLKGKIVMYYVYDNYYVLFYKHVNNTFDKVLVGNKYYLIKKGIHQVQSTKDFLLSMQYAPVVGDTMYDSHLVYLGLIKDSSRYYKIKSYNKDFLELKDSTVSFFMRWKRKESVIQDRICFQK